MHASMRQRCLPTLCSLQIIHTVSVGGKWQTKPSLPASTAGEQGPSSPQSLTIGAVEPQVAQLGAAPKVGGQRDDGAAADVQRCQALQASGEARWQLVHPCKAGVARVCWGWALTVGKLGDPNAGMVQVAIQREHQGSTLPSQGSWGLREKGGITCIPAHQHPSMWPRLSFALPHTSRTPTSVHNHTSTQA